MLKRRFRFYGRAIRTSAIGTERRLHPEHGEAGKLSVVHGPRRVSKDSALGPYRVSIDSGVGLMGPSEVELSVGRLAEVIRSRMGEPTSVLSAFWLPVQGNRDHYADDLRRELADQPVAVLVVRSKGFENPNAVLVDLISIVKRGRSEVESALMVAPDGPWAIVLLARAKLSVSQASSPATLPDWFPSTGGDSVSVI